VITSLTTTYHGGWIINSSISAKEKYFWYLPYLYHLFARGRATSKHGGGGMYNAILEFKGEQIKNYEKEKEKKMRKRKKKRKKNMSMRNREKRKKCECVQK
jgi:hypothetical protein